MARKKRGNYSKSVLRPSRVKNKSKNKKNQRNLSFESLAKSITRLEKQQKTIIDNQKKQILMLTEDEQLEEEILPAKISSVQNIDEKKDLEEIKRLEEDIKKTTQTNPIKRITYRDITKGMAGSFIAIVNQFAFADGFQIAARYSYIQSTVLLLTSFFIIVLFLYYTGFRKVDDKFVFRFLPIRAGILYIVSITVSIIVPFTFQTLTFDMPFQVIYGTIASISVLAVLGAGTADLIGKSQ